MVCSFDWELVSRQRKSVHGNVNRRSSQQKQFNKKVHDSLWWNSFWFERTPTSHLPVSLQSPYTGVSVWLAFAFCFVLLLFVGGAAGGGSWVHWWSPQFLGFSFFHFLLDGLDVQLAFCGSCDRNEVNKWGIEVSCTVTVHGFTHICFALGWLVALFPLLPLVVFFIRGFSLGGMKALFRSSCFLVSATACFTWERRTVNMTGTQVLVLLFLLGCFSAVFYSRSLQVKAFILDHANLAALQWDYKERGKCGFLAWRHRRFITVRSLMWGRYGSSGGGESTQCSPSSLPPSSSFSHFHEGRILPWPAPCQPTEMIHRVKSM